MSSSVVASGTAFIIFWSGRYCFGAVYDGAGGGLVPVRGLVRESVRGPFREMVGAARGGSAAAAFASTDVTGTDVTGADVTGADVTGAETEASEIAASHDGTGLDGAGPGGMLGAVANGGAEYRAGLAGPLSSLEASGVPLAEARELDTIVVVVDPSLMAVPLSLPFSGKKQVSALINAEFSDLVPFDADLYHKEFRALSGNADNSSSAIKSSGINTNLSEFSLMAMPKALYEELNGWLDANGIKPKIVTPACSLLSEVPQFHPATNEGTTLVIGQINFNTPNQPPGASGAGGARSTEAGARAGAEDGSVAAGGSQVALGLICNGQLVAERIVPLEANEAALGPWIAQFLIQGSQLSQTEPDEFKLLLITPSEALGRQVTPELWQRVKTALKGTVKATRRGGLVADAGDSASEAATVKISELTIGESVGGDVSATDASVANDSAGAVRIWAHLAVAQLSKSAKFKVAPNFRRQQLSKHPRMSDINRGIVRALPFVGGLLVVLLVTALIAFQIRERQLELLKYTLRLRIQEFVPNFDSPEGEEVKTLQKQNRLLDTQLKDLGTTSALNPLQAFSIISRELPSGSNITIKSINLRSNSILLSGAAPDYSAVEKIERMLKRRKDIFCRIKKDTPGSAGQADKRAFSFDISLCDNGG